VSARGRAFCRTAEARGGGAAVTVDAHGGVLCCRSGCGTAGKRHCYRKVYGARSALLKRTGACCCVPCSAAVHGATLLLPSVVPCGEHGAVLLPPWRRAAAPLVWRCHSPGVCALCSPTAPFRDDCTALLLPGMALCGGRARRRAVTPRCGVLQCPCVGAQCSAVVPRAHATGASFCAWVLICATVAS
jgi:hypothetical protein